MLIANLAIVAAYGGRRITYPAGKRGRIMMDTQDLTGYRYIGSASKNQGSIGLYWMLYPVLYQRMVVALRPWVDPMSYRISSRAVADWTRRRVAQNRAWLSFVRKRNQRRDRLAGDRRVCRSAKAAAIKTCCVGV